MVKRKNKKPILVILLFVAIFLAFLLRNQIKTGLSILYGLLIDREITLNQQDEKHTLNILLMGIGGGTHEGPELTDTVILANVNLDTKTVNLISLPRDLWIPQIEAKINTAYVKGQAKDGRGIELSKAVVEKVTGKAPDYAIIVDFEGFVKVVDALGGIEVDVERTLDDYEYPIAGKEDDLCGAPEEKLEELATASSQLEVFPCRYEHIHFDPGEQTMNGETALKFVRSRHGEGAEGSDFARSQRQQKILGAVKDKVLSLGMLLNPVKIFNVYNIVKGNVFTDIPEEEYDDFIKVAQDMKDVTIKSYVVSTGNEAVEEYGLLENPIPSEEYGYQWVLAPRLGSNDFSEIQEYVDCIDRGVVCEITATGVTEKKTATPSATIKP